MDEDVREFVTRVVILAIIGRELVAEFGMIGRPLPDFQCVLDQHQIPVVNDTHLSPALVVVFVLEVAQAVVKFPNRLAIGLGSGRVQIGQEGAGLAKQFGGGFVCLPFPRDRPRRHRQGKCGQPLGPVKPFLQHRQPREIGVPKWSWLDNPVQWLIGPFGLEVVGYSMLPG